MKKYFLGLSILFLFISHAAFARSYYPYGGYFTAGGDYSFIDAKNIYETHPSYALQVTNDKISTKDFGFKVGFGMALENHPIRIDLIFNHLSQFNFNANPLFTSASSPRSIDFKSKLTSNYGMLNGYYDLHTSGPDKIIPYITAGIGIGQNYVTSTATDNVDAFTASAQTKTYALMWQAGFGLRWKLSDRMFINAGYRFVNLGKIIWGPWQYQSGSTTQVSLESKSVHMNQLSLMAEFYLGRANGIPRLLD